jgi:hypothetical protein
MRFIRHLIALAALALSLPVGAAQQPINCAPSVPCTTGGPFNTGTGDPAGLAFGKLNTDIGVLYGLNAPFLSSQSANQIFAAPSGLSGFPSFRALTLADLPAGTSNFISGTFTSAQVLNTFSPAANGAKSVNTTDLGLLTSDGTRWLTGSLPPIPPGAALLGYKTNVYTILPTLADIAVGTTGISRLYSGYGPLGFIPPIGAYSTAGNGQLQFQYPSGGPLTAASIVTTQNAVNSQQLPGNLGQLPYLLGSQGFYIEFASTDSSNNSDVFFSLYLEPQEKNTTQNDHVPGDLPGLERWLEFDTNERGHGTDFGGGNRGAVHYGTGWGAGTGGNTTFTAALSGTSGTIATAPGGGAVWPIDSGTYSAVTSTAQSLSVTFTSGSSSVTWTPAITGTPTAVLTVRVFNKVVSFTKTTSVDYTTEHIFGFSYDPIGNTANWWQDGVSISGGPVSLASLGINPGVNAWHWFPILAAQSHGANFGYTTNVRSVSAWAP